MKCSYCNKDIPEGTGIESNGLHYCDNMHRFLHKKEGNQVIPQTQTPKNKPIFGKSRIVTIIAVIIFSSIGATYGKKAAEYVKNFFGSKTLDAELMKIANEMNKNCPFMVDQATRLDSTLASENKTISYFYTLVSMTAEQVNSDQLIEYLSPRIISNIQTNPDMKYLRDKSVSFVYHYRDSEGKSLFIIEVLPEDYK